MEETTKPIEQVSKPADVPAPVAQNHTMSKNVIIAGVVLVVILCGVGIYALKRTPTREIHTITEQNVVNKVAPAVYDTSTTSITNEINQINVNDFDTDFQSIDSDIGGL